MPNGKKIPNKRNTISIKNGKQKRVSPISLIFDKGISLDEAIKRGATKKEVAVFKKFIKSCIKEEQARKAKPRYTMGKVEYKL